MSVLTASKIDVSQITGDQIGACHKCFSGSTAFYMVQSATDADTEYKVSWSRERGFQCQCKAAQNGRLCWHVKASIACEREVREAVKEMEISIAVQAAMSDPATIQAAEAAAIAPTVVKRERATAPIERKAFSILR